MRKIVAALVLAIAPTAAWADTATNSDHLRDLCFDRPGLGTPACTVDTGHVVTELGLADWTHDKTAPFTSDEIDAGDALVRFGLNDNLEAQIGWTAFGRERVRDASSGLVDHSSGIGDLTLALRRNLRNPDGSGFSVAVMPYATLPTGGGPLGAGDWGAGLIVPVSYDLGGVTVSLSPELDAAVDEDGDGRHFRFGSVVGLGFDLTPQISVSAETAVFRDLDSSGHTTDAVAGLSAGWQPTGDMQFDIGMNIGLVAASPDTELYVGVARRF